MIGSVLAEIEASATASLGAQITAVAALRSVSLTATFGLYNWWQSLSDDLTPLDAGPMLAVSWVSTETGLIWPVASVRDGLHRVRVAHTTRTASETTARAQLLYIPEALLRWLDAFPIHSRDATKTISKIDATGGTGVTITPVIANHREDETHVSQWIVRSTLEFSVKARDS